MVVVRSVYVGNGELTHKRKFGEGKVELSRREKKLRWTETREPR
jgi:hypothetical protein